MVAVGRVEDNGKSGETKGNQFEEHHPKEERSSQKNEKTDITGWVDINWILCHEIKNKEFLVKYIVIFMCCNLRF